MTKAEFSYPTPVDDMDKRPVPSFNHSSKYKKKNKKSYLLFGSIALIIIILAAGGALLYSKHNKPKDKTISKSQQVLVPVTNSPSHPSTTQYVSNEQVLNLSFSYPSDWTVSPAKTSSTGTSSITVTSPLATITNASGASTTGKVVVSVRPSSAGIDELTSGSAVATVASQQIGYTAPASDQYQYPYITFISLSGANPVASFNEIMVTGPFQFTQGETINSADLTGLDPVISASLYSCTTAVCTGSAENNLMVTSTTWQNANILQQTQTIFKSFVLN